MSQTVSLFLSSSLPSDFLSNKIITSVAIDSAMSSDRFSSMTLQNSSQMHLNGYPSLSFSLTFSLWISVKADFGLNDEWWSIYSRPQSPIQARSVFPSAVYASKVLYIPREIIRTRRDRAGCEPVSEVGVEIRAFRTRFMYIADNSK